MNKIIPGILLLLFSLIVSASTHAATITWANTNGGNWTVATNWIPAQVPVNGDDVIITNNGSYAITNASNVKLGNLTLGGMTGIQILNISSLTLTNSGVINSNGIFNWNGGDLEGSLTVAQGGTLTISNSVTFDAESPYTNNTTLTNYGTVIWAANLTSYANSASQGGTATIDNAGLWEAVANNTISVEASGATNTFSNTGTLEKIGGTGTTTINWGFISSGIIQTPVGSFNLKWSGPSTLNGNLTLSSTIAAPLTVASNAVLNLAGGDLESSLTVAQGGTLTISNTVTFDAGSPYTNNAALTNYGTVIWAGTISSYANAGSQGGTATIDNAGLWESVANNTISVEAAGTTNLFINTGTLEKIGGTGSSAINWDFENNGGTINTLLGSFSMGKWISSGLVYGNATFSSGTIAGTLAAAAVMNFSATINAALTVSSNAVANWNGGDLEGSLTVAQGGTLTISNSVTFDAESPYTNNTTLTNYGTVIWAANLTSYANSASQGGTATIDNAGLWEAVANNTISVEASGATNTFSNTGTLEKIGGTGTTTINWGFISSGIIQTPVGSFNLKWSGPSTLNGNLTLSSTIAAPLTVASNAVLNLAGGDLESSLTVAQGGTLTISNTVTFDAGSPYTNNAALTNYGTVIWAGTISSYANAGSQGGSATIDNAGLWESVANNTLSVEASGGTNLFLNTGTLEKIGGNGTTAINWGLDNEGGSIETSAGYFTFNGVWNGSKLVYGNANFSGHIGGIIGSNAVLTWLGGDLESTLTVAAGGTLVLSNTVTFDAASPYTNDVTLTNYGTVVWADSILSYANLGSQGGTATIVNAGLWEAVADYGLTIENSTATNLFINTGSLEKIGGSSTSTINWDFVNDGGILGSQTNVLSLAGKYDLTGGTLNFGINSLTSFGKIELGGNPATLAGSVSANLNYGYVPATGSSFPVLTYSSANGNFTNLISPFAVALGSSYASTTFTLRVLNVRPVLGTPADQVVDELTPLSVDNPATDMDALQTLTYSLLNPPAGASINSSGAITWTPNEAQGPGTNVLTTVVTDNGLPALSVTNNFTVVINEINIAPVLILPVNSTINELVPYSANATATDSDLPANPLTFALVSGPSGLTVSLSGGISWTPTEAQGPGVYTVSIKVSDTNVFAVNATSLSETNSYQITVNEVNSAPSLTLPANASINELTLYSATATAVDSDIPANPLTFALVSGPSGLTVSTTGAISWTPTEAQGPSTNTVTISVTDTNPAAVNATSLSVTNSYQLIVNEVNSAPVLGTLINRTVNPGQVINFTTTATDSDVPTNTLTFSLISPPVGINLDSASGLFNWRPTIVQANTTNTVQIRVTDNGIPPLSDTNSFTVIINPLAPVILTPLGYTNSQFKLKVEGTTGPDYIISASTNLIQWSDLITNLSPATPFQFTNINLGPLNARFYRARLSP